MSILTKPVGTTSMLPLLMRLILGAAFFAHGAQKVLGWYGGNGLDATVAQFERGLGIPLPLGYIAAFTEFLGGIALIMGLITRFFSIAILVEMVVAVWMVHLPRGYFLTSQGYEYNLALIGLALAITLTGPGHFSLDYQFFEVPQHHEKPYGDVRFAPR